MSYASCEEFIAKRYLPVLALLLLVTAVVYSGAIRNGFVWDDHEVVVNYPLNRTLGNLPQFFTESDSIRGWPTTPYYRPLARLTYLLDYQIFRLRPWGYHLENMLLHLANILLVFCTARKLFGEILPALLAASFFAVHPAICEPVFAVFARNTLLALFFSLAAFLVFQRALLDDSFNWGMLSGLLLLLGLLSKETAIAVVPVIGWHYYSKQSLPLKRAILLMAPMAAALAVYAFLRSHASAGVFPHAPETGILNRLAQDIYIIPRYVQLLVAPVNLTVLHDAPLNAPGVSMLLILAWSAIAVCIVTAVRSGNRAVTFGFVWAVCALIPVLGIVEIPGAPLAERHLYIPFAGLSMSMAAAASAILRKYLIFGISLFALLMVLYMTGTARRSADWRTDITLFRQAISVNPVSASAHYNLGNAYLESGSTDAAIREWMNTVRIDPNAHDAFCQIGSQLIFAGRYSEALTYLERAVKLKPAWFYAQSNLAVALDMLGRREEAIQRYEQVLRIVPPDRRDSIPLLNERITQLRESAHNHEPIDKILIRKEIFN